jgi:fructose-specific PTS system IIA-like component
LVKLPAGAEKELMVAASSDRHEYQFICPLPNGLHARPANCLEQFVSRFKNRVSVTNLSSHKVANAHSILSLVGADIKAGDACLVTVEGNGSALACQEIARFLETEFPVCDNALPESSSSSGDAYIPPVLRAAGVRVFPGKPVVAGFGRGCVVLVEAIDLPEVLAETEIADTRQELAKIKAAVTALQNDMTLKLGSGRLSAMEKDVLKAHLSIAGDVELLEKITSLIKENHVCAGKAITQSFEHFSAILRLAQSELIRERIADLKDICSQLLKAIYGSTIHDRIVLTKPSVCIADNLTPSQFIALDKAFLSGLVLTQGGNTSHTAILARSFGIPMLTGFKDADSLLENGQDVIVDANYGFLLADINKQVERFYAFERQKKDCRQQQIAVFKDKPAGTRDGAALAVMANVSLAEEVQAAIRNGAEGIGLFRTEMLFMGRDAAPDEREQFEEYKKAAVDAGGKPVIIRTLDVGGDKAVAYLNLTAEENPFLGYRGVRIYKQYEDLFKTQLRAILRASAFGTLKLMIPMVTCIEEIIYVRYLLEQVKSELDSESVFFNRALPLGIMAEVPSVAFIIPQLSEFIDFLSIGTNDLTQYLLAVDRGNQQVSSLYQARHPAAIALIKKIADDAHAHHLRVGMCGEMAGQVELLPFLLGAGLDEASVSIPSIMDVKAQCCELDSRQCRGMLEQAVRAGTIEQVDSILKNRNTLAVGQPVIDAYMVDLDADCINKEEVIKYISDRLYARRRTQNPLELEEDFWRREKIYSTGLGYGFAIPHCKTSHVHANSICVLRLKQPVTWGSVDNLPVNIIIGMTIQDAEHAANTHMKIFSTLARRIMHADFRQRLKDIQDKNEIVAYLYEKLELE